jgi:outer membrane protein TolC
MLCICGSSVYGQEVNFLSESDTNKAVDVDTITVELTQFLPPLAVLIDSALANSPEIDFYEARVKEKEYLVEVEKKRWAENIYLDARYGYGNLGTFQVNTVQSGVNDTVTTGQATTNYQLGVGVRVPLDVFYGRSARIKAVEASRESEAAKMREMQNYIKDRVIASYTRVASMKRLLQIYSEAKESAEFILTMSEERFRDGEIGLDELGQNTELKAKYSALYENLRTDYATEYAQLERLVGVPFSKFEN